MVVKNMNIATNMNGITGIIRILLSDDTVYEAPCSEQECLTAMERLGPVVYETTTYSLYSSPRSITELRAPYGMAALEFNAKRNIMSVCHGDIKRIYWEANI